MSKVNMSDLVGQIFWVTGASSGIGKALCQSLANRGAYLILSSRQTETLEQVKSKLINSEKHHVLPLDLADSENFDAITENAWSLFGKIDYLINNGGISQRSLCLETDESVDRRLMEVDYFGTIKLTKLVAKKMVIIQSGTIVSISSIAGKVGSPYRSAYSGAKHALIGFMDCLRAEITQFGVRVLVVCPGWVQTDISRNALTGDMSQFGQLDKEIENGMPLEHFIKRLIKVIQSNKEEVVIADGMPLLAAHARRLLPNLFHKIIRKIYKK
jgi:short-subunit dehydrogenase